MDNSIYRGAYPKRLNGASHRTPGLIVAEGLVNHESVDAIRGSGTRTRNWGNADGLNKIKLKAKMSKQNGLTS